jgi:nitrite reductase/ring-hydroxylating ferredoxin subunit
MSKPLIDPDETRREFLRTGGCMMLAIVTAGALPPDLLALPIQTITGTTSGKERKYPLPATDGVSVDRTAQVILVRNQGRAMAFALSCPHQNAAVKWSDKDQRFKCTKHDSKYQPDGTYTSGRATRNMDRFAIRTEGQELVVDLSHVFHSDKDATGWAAAFVKV